MPANPNKQKATDRPRTAAASRYAPVSVVQPRVCPTCARSLPLHDFKRLPGDARCEDCVEKAKRDQQKAERESEVKRVAAELLDAADAGGRGAPTLDEIIGAVMDEFGGYRVFAHEWAEQLKYAFQKYPGRVGNLQQAAGIAKLVGASDRNQTVRDVAKMTDEQLAKERELALMEMLSQTMASDARASMIRMLCNHQGVNPDDLLARVTSQEELEASLSEEDAA